MNQYPPSEWNGQPSGPRHSPATSEFGPVPPHQYPNQYQQGYGPPPPGKQGMSTALVVVLTVVIVVLIGLIVAAAFLVVPRFLGSSAGPETSTVSVTATAPADTGGSDAGAEAVPTVQPARPAQGSRPAGAYECTSVGSGPYDSVAVGSSVTSCEFAESVWSQYVRTGTLGQSKTVRAYSPVTGMSYTMSCSGGAVVTCTGGNNAVVHIY